MGKRRNVKGNINRRVKRKKKEEEKEDVFGRDGIAL